MNICHDSLKTGAITMYVIIPDSEIISIFGGDCWSPRPWRKIEKTITKYGKQVKAINMPGASENAATDRKKSVVVSVKLICW